MILYEGTIETFNDDVMQNCVADRAAEKYTAHYNRKPASSEYRSWQNSLPILNQAFRYADLKDNKILLEYELPYSSQRIDVLLFGKDVSDTENIVILELKQWSNDGLKDSDSEGNILIKYASWREQAHPSLQVEGYYYHLKDFKKIFEEKMLLYLVAQHMHTIIQDKIMRFYFLINFRNLLKSFHYLGKKTQ